MPIIIENIGGDMGGICRYQVRVNDEVITTFKHDRCYGLGECLKKAASAVKYELSTPNGKYLKKLREANKVTLKDVSLLSGKSISFISDIEHGRKLFGKTATYIKVMLEDILSANSTKEEFYAWMRDNGRNL